MTGRGAGHRGQAAPNSVAGDAGPGRAGQGGLARARRIEEIVERAGVVGTAQAIEGIGAVAGWPAVDTVKVVDADRWILRTPDRSSLWLAQTPQVFPRSVVVEAYRSASTADLAATDDASLVEDRGHEVRMVRGSPRNIKVTRPADLDLARTFVETPRTTPEGAL